MTDGSFELTPTSPFRLDLTVWTLRRRPHNILDRWDGTTYRRLLASPAGPLEVAVSQLAPSESARLRIVVTGQTVCASIRAQMTSTLERLLELHVDMTPFDRVATQHTRLRHLADRFRGMRPPRSSKARSTRSRANRSLCHLASICSIV